MLNISSARLASETVRHETNASFAACTAWSISSTDARSTAPLCRPVAGLNTGLVRPEVPATVAPPIQWWMGVMRLSSVSVARSPGAGCELRHVSLLKMCLERSEREPPHRPSSAVAALQAPGSGRSSSAARRREAALSAIATTRSKAAALDASLPVSSNRSIPAWAASAATDGSVRPLVAAAPSSASVIVTPLKPSSAGGGTGSAATRAQAWCRAPGRTRWRSSRSGTPARDGGPERERDRSARAPPAGSRSRPPTGRCCGRPADPGEVLHGRRDRARAPSPRGERNARRADHGGRAERPLVERHERPGPRDIGDGGEIDVRPRPSEERPAGCGRLGPDARRPEPAELGCGGGGPAQRRRRTPPPSWSVAISSGGRPAPRAARCRLTSAAAAGPGSRCWSRRGSRRRSRPGRIRPGATPRVSSHCIATTDRWPTSSSVVGAAVMAVAGASPITGPVGRRSSDVRASVRRLQRLPTEAECATEGSESGEGMKGCRRRCRGR